MNQLNLIKYPLSARPENKLERSVLPGFWYSGTNFSQTEKAIGNKR